MKIKLKCRCKPHILSIINILYVDSLAVPLGWMMLLGRRRCRGAQPAHILSYHACGCGGRVGGEGRPVCKQPLFRVELQATSSRTTGYFDSNHTQLRLDINSALSQVSPWEACAGCTSAASSWHVQAPVWCQVHGKALPAIPRPLGARGMDDRAQPFGIGHVTTLDAEAWGTRCRGLCRPVCCGLLLHHLFHRTL